MMYVYIYGIFQSEVRAGFPSDGGARGAFAPGPAVAALPAAARGGPAHHLHVTAQVSIEQDIPIKHFSKYLMDNTKLLNHSQPYPTKNILMYFILNKIMYKFVIYI